MFLSAYDDLFFDLRFIKKTHGFVFTNLDEATKTYARLDHGHRWNASVLFSRKYYIKTYSDIALDADPLMHFLKIGLKHGRRPHPLFDSEYVASQTNFSLLSHIEYYRRFLDGQINASPHPLIDIGFIKNQIGQHLMPHEIFRLLADEGQVLNFMPHPLFDPSYYAKHQVMAVPNALMDYVLNAPIDGESHPLFSPSYYLARQSFSRFQGSALTHYLRCWSSMASDPSLFVDLQFAVQQQELIYHNSNQDPLVVGLKLSSSSGHPTLNPCVEPTCLQFAFSNLFGDAQNLCHARQLAIVIEALTPKKRQSVNSFCLPLISVVIVNFFQPAGTALSIYSAINALNCLPIEIIIIETGGDITSHAELRRLFSNVHDVFFYKVDADQRCVDGNNIGIDRVRGQYVLFLSAASVLHHSWGAEFSAMLLNSSVTEAAIGQRLNPDGFVEDVGTGVAQVRVLFSEFADALPDRYQALPVDLISGGCLLISQRALSKVIGFDPAFQPFFDEADLCCRLEKMGIPVTATSNLRFMRSNNSFRTKDIGEEGKLRTTQHQTLFARRWLMSQLHSTNSMAEPPQDNIPFLESHVTPRAVAVIYTPFPIGPDERNFYLLSITRCVATTHDVVICTDQVVSSARVYFTRLSLGIDPFEFKVKTYSEISRWREPPAVALILGNQIIPPIPPIARLNIYLLEFPYPSRDAHLTDFDRIERFDAILVASDFTREWAYRRLHEAAIRDAPNIIRLYPPVHGKPRARARSAGLKTIVTNGQFTTGSRSKRQDIFLEIVESARAISNSPFNAVIMGSIDDCREARNYYARVAQQAKFLGSVRLIPEPSHSEVAKELSEADIFLDCTGYNVAAQAAPEDTEHYGVFLVQAIAAGCYPLVYRAGVSAEFLRNANIGQTFVDAQEAATMICQHNNFGSHEFVEAAWVRELSTVNFDTKLAAIIAEPAIVAKPLTPK